MSFIFLKEVFPAEYGPQYDSDLQMLFWEFLCRLAQLLPVPDLEQVSGVILIKLLSHVKRKQRKNNLKDHLLQ